MSCPPDEEVSKFRGDVHLSLGTRDAAAVSYLLKSSRLRPVAVQPLVLPQLQRYDRASPQMSNYDQLLEQEVAR